MKVVTPTELRADIYNLLDQVLNTGIPIEVIKGNQRLKIVPVDKVDKFQNLTYRPDAILGDPDDLVNITWEDEVNLDLP